ncbi:hypothetical protein Syun_015118 [Stephania yunnanensis]|uniref:Uncharacterized protein n=1 Tax=Stephania yunnanensis TaxID=152371 RepID=A0AAP0P938_9MAGN
MTYSIALHPLQQLLEGANIPQRSQIAHPYIKNIYQQKFKRERKNVKLKISPKIYISTESCHVLQKLQNLEVYTKTNQSYRSTSKKKKNTHKRSKIRDAYTKRTSSNK